MDVYPGEPGVAHCPSVRYRRCQCRAVNLQPAGQHRNLQRVRGAARREEDAPPCRPPALCPQPPRASALCPQPPRGCEPRLPYPRRRCWSPFPALRVRRPLRAPPRGPAPAALRDTRAPRSLREAAAAFERERRGEAPSRRAEGTGREPGSGSPPCAAGSTSVCGCAPCPAPAVCAHRARCSDRGSPGRRGGSRVRSAASAPGRGYTTSRSGGGERAVPAERPRIAAPPRPSRPPSLRQPVAAAGSFLLPLEWEGGSKITAVVFRVFFFFFSVGYFFFFFLKLIY